MNNATTNNLVLHNICKSYGAKDVIQDFSYKFSKGCHVLVGQNGGGKSTLLKLICGAEKIDSGSIHFNKYDLAHNEVAFKQQLGYAPDKLMIYPFLTGEEFLSMVFSIKKIKDQHSIDDIFNGFRIKPYLSYRLEEMSLGNQKKFMLAAAFIGNPNLLLLDEPTNEIDIDSKAYLITLITQKNNEGKTVICSSHDEEFMAKINPIKHSVTEILKTEKVK